MSHPTEMRKKGVVRLQDCQASSVIGKVQRSGEKSKGFFILLAARREKCFVTFFQLCSVYSLSSTSSQIFLQETSKKERTVLFPALSLMGWGLSFSIHIPCTLVVQKADTSCVFSPVLQM